MKVTVIGDLGYAATAACYHLAYESGEVDKAEMAVANAPLITGHDNEFEIPKNIPIAAIPLIGETAFRPMSFNQRLRGRPSANAMRKLNYIGKVPNDTGFYFEMDWEKGITEVELIDEIRRSDKVYVVHSSRSDGAHTAGRIRDWLAQLRIDRGPLFCAYDDIRDPDSYRRAFLAPSDGRTLDDQSVSWGTKRYFDYNYLVNSTSVMRLTSMRAIGRDVGKSLSSQALQALFHLRETSDLAKEAFLAELHSWHGTGRYAIPETVAWGEGVVGMFERERLARITDNGNAEITEDGERLLAAIHPDCRDPDQLQRLAQWRGLPESQAREKIDQYIRTFFGKQSRFLNEQDVVTPIR